MKIALITDGIWPYVLGGMQKHSYNLCKYLARHQVHIDLYHFNQSQYDIDQLEFFTPEEKQYIHSQVIPFPEAKSFPGHYLYESWQYSERVFEAIRPHLQEYDFIYTKGFSGWKLINEKYKGRVEAPPLAVKFHGYEMFQRQPSRKAWLQSFLFLRQPVRQISRRADVVFSYGARINDIVCNLGIDPYKIHELPSGIDEAWVCSEAGPLHTPLRFVFLGRYERRKGIEELNQVLRELKNETFEMAFIGPVPADKQLQQANVTYHGEIRDGSKVQELLRDSDILICPSWSEGMPNVILEAMANGLAVIATDVGAVGMLVGPDNGCLIKPNNEAELKQAILQLIKDPALAQKKQCSIHKLKEGFLWSNIADRLVRIMKASEHSSGGEKKGMHA